VTRRGRQASAGRAVVLLASAVLFAVTLRLAGGGEPVHTLLKLVLLLAVPLLLFRLSRTPAPARRPARRLSTDWRRYGPLVPVAVWCALTFTGPWAVPAGGYANDVDLITLTATIAVVFAVNSLLEEVFYRRRLQTRWEHVLGYLWSRYRAMWPLLVVHGSLNAAPILLGTL